MLDEQKVGGIGGGMNYGPMGKLYTQAEVDREVANAVAAERERSAQLWRHYAYAALGMQRDQMTPEDVAAVQRFLGPLEA